MGIAGQINSLALVVGPKALIETKIFYKEILPHVPNRHCWDKQIRISAPLRDALLHWNSFLSQFCGHRSFTPRGDPTVVFSDASATGSGAFIANLRTPNAKDKYLPPELGSTADICLRSWADPERLLSSTWRELKIIEEGLRAFRKQLKGKAVCWYTDNLGGTSVIRRGSMKDNLNPLAKHIADWCSSEDIDLKVSWIRRTGNEDADRLSHFIDLDDWAIVPHLCLSLQQRWFACSVDRFASALNTKLQRFNSRFASPGCEAVDAFSQRWSAEDNWLVPPPALIPAALEHLLRDKAQAILLCPRWPSAPFWPFLFKRTGPAAFVKDFYIIHAAGRFLIPGNQSASIFSPAFFKGEFLALHLDVHLL